jgi:hypothetical protein
MNSSKQKYTKKSYKKLITLSIIAVLVVGAGAAAYTYHRHTSHKNDTAGSGNNGVRPQNTIDYSPGTPEDNKSNEDRKDNPGTGTGGTLDSSPVPTNEFSVTITGANPDNASRVVRVGTLVEGTTSGDCVLTLSQSGQHDVTFSNSVTLQNNSYVCPVFSVPYDSIPASGDWTVKVTLTKDNKQATGTWQGGPVSVNK